MTKLQGEEIELAKTLIKKKISPNKKYSFNYENTEQKSMNKLPTIHQRSFSPQVKNLKLEIMNKFRQNNRIKTEVSDNYVSKGKKSKNEQPVSIHINKKQIMSKGQLMINKNNHKGKVDQADGFLLTFSKTRGKKFSELCVSNSNSTRHAKPVWIFVVY